MSRAPSPPEAVAGKESHMMRTIDVRLFGAFRQFGSRPSMTVDVPHQATVSELRAAVERRLPGGNARALLHASVFATDERTLDESEPVPFDRDLSVLPPVCGG